MAKKKIDFDDQDDFDFDELEGQEAAELADQVQEEELVVEEPETEAEEAAEVEVEAGEDDIVAVEDEEAVAGDEEAVAVAEEDEETVAVVDEDEEAVAVADEDGDKDDEDEDKEVKEEEEEKPVAKVTALTMVLCGLNILAACAFLFLLLMNYEKRQQWQYGTALQHMALDGVPLEEQSKRLTAAEATQPPIKVNADQVYKEFQNRRTGVSVPAKDFQDVYAVLQSPIKPENFTKKMMDDLFRPVGGQPVKTLEEEVKRVQGQLVADIEQAANASAEEAAKKPPAEQRRQLKKILLPMAYTTAQIKEEEEKINKAGDLKALWAEAVQRRMYFDLLRVLQVYRYWNLEEPLLEEAIGAKAVPLDKLKSNVEERLADLLQKGSTYYELLGKKYEQTFSPERETFEKRDNIGFFLVAAANLRLPPDGQLLYPREQDEGTKKYQSTRAQVVLGLVDYVRATNTLAAVVKKINENSREMIVAGREGVAFEEGGTLYHLAGFVVQYEELVQKLVELVANIEARQKRINDLQKQLTEVKQILQNRAMDFEDAKTKLLENQKYTAQLAKDLEKLQKDLHHSYQEMAKIMELNEQMERDIADSEKKLKVKAKP